MQIMVLLISWGRGGGGAKYAENGTFDINGSGREVRRKWYF